MRMLDRELTRPQFKVLERIFRAETKNQLPAQFKSKHLAGLQESGMVTPMAIMLAGRFPVRVEGWALTEAGRMLYRRACTAVED